MQACEPVEMAVPLWKRLVFGRSIKRTLIRAVVLGLLTWVVFHYTLLPVRVSGISMEPTYHDGKVNLINRLAYLWKKPARGDVVAVRTAGVHIMYLKRIIALPGETIGIENGIVQIDGKALDEPYLVKRQPWNIASKQLKNNEYYLIGDNRRMPAEFHKFGITEADHIVGKVLW